LIGISMPPCTANNVTGVKKSWFRTEKRCGGEGADHYRRQH
jgi:hypothetical protein